MLFWHFHCKVHSPGALFLSSVKTCSLLRFKCNPNRNHRSHIANFKRTSLWFLWLFHCFLQYIRVFLTYCVCFCVWTTGKATCAATFAGNEWWVNTVVKSCACLLKSFAPKRLMLCSRACVTINIKCWADLSSKMSKMHVEQACKSATHIMNKCLSNVCVETVKLDWVFDLECNFSDTE